MCRDRCRRFSTFCATLHVAGRFHATMKRCRLPRSCRLLDFQFQFRRFSIARHEDRGVADFVADDEDFFSIGFDLAAFARHEAGVVDQDDAPIFWAGNRFEFESAIVHRPDWSRRNIS